MSEGLASDSLRIGLVAHSGLGGSGTVATEIAIGLAERGHRVHMIMPKRPFRLILPTGVVVHEVEAMAHPMWETPPWGFALAARITSICREVELDVLHAHFAIPYASATELATHMLATDAPPWALTLHGSDVEVLSANDGYAELLRHVLRRAHRVTVPSRHLLTRLNEMTAAMPEHVSVIPNFVDCDRFAPRAELLPPSAGPVVIHASSFRPVKRVRDVVSIFATLAARLPVRLLLVGDGPDRAEAISQLGALGLGDRVVAPGACTDVERWMQQAHLALLPSERESFGLAGLEALACGVPVVGSRVGGLPEVVADGAAGHLAAVGDVQAMADAAHRLLSDDARWVEASRAARTRALHFQSRHGLDAYERLYRSMLRTSPFQAPPLEP